MVDERYVWLRHAMAMLYMELDDGSVPASLTLIAASGKDLVSYGIAPDSDNIQKLIVTNPTALMAAAEATTVNASVD